MILGKVWRLSAGAALLAAGFGALGCQPYRSCDPVDEAAVAELPSRLSQTGLYAPETIETLATGVRNYRPRFELWSDGASKQRWIWLPPGKQIDTSDLDSWQFPVETKVWKEFSRGGTRVETRLLERLERGWVSVAYIWNQEGTDALAAPYGAIDARGTAHDVPAANECGACHDGRKSYVLGFSALQLTEPAEGDGLDLDELVTSQLVSAAPVAAPRVPGNDTEQAALGYLYANCSHCHNAARPSHSGARCFDPQSDIDFSLQVDAGPNVAETAAYRTTKGVCIEPGQPGDSRMVELMDQRGRFEQMPPLATDVVDKAAVALVRRWIEEM